LGGFLGSVFLLTPLVKKIPSRPIIYTTYMIRALAFLFMIFMPNPELFLVLYFISLALVQVGATSLSAELVDLTKKSEQGNVLGFRSFMVNAMMFTSVSIYTVNMRFRNGILAYPVSFIVLLIAFLYSLTKRQCRKSSIPNVTA